MPVTYDWKKETEKLVTLIMQEEHGATRQEILHWLADSDEAGDIYVSEIRDCATQLLTVKYPRWTKNYWWKVR